MSQQHILIVDDEPDIRNLISDILADEGYSVATAANGEEANKQLTSKQPDLVLLDIWMPDIDGISLMKGWIENNLVTAPIVMMSGHGTVETAVEATRLGAKDFIEKPLSLAKLLQTVADTLAQSNQQELIESSVDIELNLLEPIGSSEAINQVKTALERIAKTKNHIVIEGEYGTGKYTTAILIHQKRYGNNQPCVTLDIKTIDDFDAKATAINGSFSRSKSGSLIINNVDCLSKNQQDKLFSYLKHSHYTIAEQNTPQPIDFQIIAISESSLSAQINAKHFSNELYQLLAEDKIYLPNLKQRQEDVPELITYFVNTLPDTEQTPYRKMSFAAQNTLRNHQWHDNIHELKNIVRQLLLNDIEGEISLEEVNTLLTQQTQSEPAVFHNWYKLPLREARDAFEKDYLIHQLKAVDGRVGELAKVAGMERTHLYRKMRALDINPKEITKS